jgi:hypothetical protein
MNLNLTAAGRLSECLLLSYRTPADSVRHLLPRGLELVTRGGYAFWNVVACTVEHMRPALLPACCGVTYHHVAYRLHVQARTATGDGTLRGLYFVRSDADSGLVGRLGNLFTDFRFRPAAVELSSRDGVLTVAVQGRGGAPDPRDGEPAGDPGDAIARVTVDGNADAGFIAPGSPFASVAEAERILRYVPLAMSVDLDGRYLKLAEVVRDDAAWRERPVRVLESHFRFFDALGLPASDVQLERATRVDPINYRWKLGRRVALATAPATPLPGKISPARPARAAA